MMKDRKIYILLIVGLFVCGSLCAQNWGPQIGYIYPAGGQQGTTVRVVVGGQYIMGTKDIEISGKGISVEIIDKTKPFPNLNKERRYLVADALMNTLKKRMKEQGMEDDSISAVVDRMKKQQPWKILKTKPDEMNLKDETIPAHPLLIDIDRKSAKEIMHAKQIIFAPYRYKQKNRQLAESVIIEVTIDSDAKPGERKLRINSGKKGFSNSMIFQVGKVSEKHELEPNNIKAFEPTKGFPELNKILKGDSFDLPFVVNGQIMPGDVDRFRFKAKKGQKLLFEAEARRLIPYLADAVPGWFQAVVALYDSDGKEVAFADDHFINPDPVMFFKVPEDGEYELEIRDAVYRGREDFVYRVTVRDAPWAEKELAKGSKYGDRWTKRAVFPVGMVESDIIPKDVLALPKAEEGSKNNSIKAAQKIKMPVLLDGSISEPGDVDVYKVRVDKASKIAVEVYGRRLGSPVDTVVKVTDRKGKIIALNDDYVQKLKHLHIDVQGIITHHADSRLVADLPGNGDYYVHVMDVQNAGGPQYGYRVRISEPMPGFSVMASPSSVFTRVNEHVPLTLYADRRDGFDGAIDFEFGEGSEFAVTGGDIPEGQLSSVVTVQTRTKGTGKKGRLDLKAVATVDGKKVSSDVKAADRVMQAFLYEHLMPAGKLSAVVRKEKWGSALLDQVDSQPVQLKPGESELLKFKTSWCKEGDEYDVAIDHAPEGVSVDKKPKLTDKVFEFNLIASKDYKPQEANIVLSIWTSRERVKKDGKKVTDRWRSYRLPAIKVQVSGDGGQ